ncbi:class I SAM-dependent methyltransferase [Mesorhizobium mediterraneum]|nr:methyltransferase [Mesorhizobium mediterraneum]WIW52025.1 class I SAM-dependent methyltransferase [Mesorhizobium mediterraneum]
MSPVGRWSQSDAQYTSPELASTLLSHCGLRRPVRIADFAAGNGSLIRAARARWTDAFLYANDFDVASMHEIKKQSLASATDELDFIDSEFINKSSILNEKKFCLILLNPPFSGGGNIPFKPRGRFSMLRCSKPMSFIITALEHLADHGEILAILPTTTLHGNLDRDARALLREKYDFSITKSPEYGHFPRVDASIYMARIRSGNSSNFFAEQAPLATDGLPWRITRGNASIARKNRMICDSAVGMVHTTGLRDGRIVERYELPNDGRVYRRSPKGSILLPRVGALKLGSIVRTSRTEVMSDCLFSIKGHDASWDMAISSALRQRFSELASLFAGTGAPFLTVERLQRFLIKAIGV